MVGAWVVDKPLLEYNHGQRAEPSQDGNRKPQRDGAKTADRRKLDAIEVRWLRDNVIHTFRDKMIPTYWMIALDRVDEDEFRAHSIRRYDDAAQAISAAASALIDHTGAIALRSDFGGSPLRVLSTTVLQRLGDVPNGLHETLEPPH